MIKWPVEIGERSDSYAGQILVPQAEMDLAGEDLMVSHLRSYGFKITSTIISVGETVVFEPEMRLKDHRPIPKEIPVVGFKPGDKFEIISSGDRLEISSSSGGIELKYINIGKANIRTTVAQLEKVLSLNAWKRI